MNAVVDKTGQITIPTEIRQKLGLVPGSVVDFEVDGHGQAIIRKVSGEAAEPLDRFERLRGSLKIDMTTDEIMAMTRGES